MVETSTSGTSMSHPSLRPKLPSFLLTCGILSAVLYFVADIWMSATYEGYSFLHQTVSELNAIGAPTTDLSIVLGIAGHVLLILFGIGIWPSAGENRSLRIFAGAIAALGAFVLWAAPYASMQQRGSPQEGPHLLSGAIGALLVITAIGFAANALGMRFRRYSIGTILVMMGFAAWAAKDAGRIEAGLETPWVGVIERVSFYSWHLWFIALALRLSRRAG